MTAKERGLPFTSQNVRAVMADRKTQTRRLVKWPEPHPCHDHDWTYAVIDDGWPWWRHFDSSGLVRAKAVPCPYGNAGDVQYIKEGLRINGAGTTAVYDADGLPVMLDGESVDWKWKVKALPSIYMPRFAARTFVENTLVRVERLADISEEDALAEGGWEYRNCPIHKNPIASFRELWHTIHAADGPNGWNASPWVWAISFKRIAATR